MNPHRVVMITAGSAEESQKLSRGLVEEKLAYCVNTLPGITSTYFWDGKICEDAEFLLIVKTRAEKLDALKDWVQKHHSYDVPEVIALPILEGLPAYLKCIDDWVG